MRVAQRVVLDEATWKQLQQLARSLRMILEELMLDLMYHLPSNKRARDLEITKDMVERRDLSLCLLEKAG